MAEYMGEYKIIRKMDGGGNANVFVAENVREIGRASCRERV